MSFLTNKEEFEKELKELLKSRGKEELSEALEDFVELAYEALKLLVKHSDNKIDDVILATLDELIDSVIDKIDGKQEE